MPTDTTAEITETLIRDVVERFYARARADDLLGPIFRRVVADEDWQQHIDTITDFWSSVLLSTRRYHGRPMPKHVSIPELDDAHFQRWLKLFSQTAFEASGRAVGEIMTSRAEKIANAMRLSIAIQRGENTIHMKPLAIERTPL